MKTSLIFCNLVGDKVDRLSASYYYLYFFSCLYFVPHKYRATPMTAILGQMDCAGASWKMSQFVSVPSGSSTFQVQSFHWTPMPYEARSDGRSIFPPELLWEEKNRHRDHQLA